MNKTKSLFYLSIVIGNLIFIPQLNINAHPYNYQTIVNYNLGKRLANNYLEKIPITSNPNLSFNDALQVQNQFIKTLTPSLGKTIGYKVGLTSKQAQTHFNVSSPLAGELLEKMLLPNGSKIPANFGSIPMIEGDLIVIVGNDNINKATTSAEILQNLDAVIPFIELPDLVYSKDVNLDAAALVAINVGARLGVIGEPIIINNDSNWQEILGNINLVMLDENNNKLGQGNSQLLLGHPLNVVLWLKDNLKSQGKYLKKGDLISLGTITPMIPAKSGQIIKAQYSGLIPNKIVEISVSFEEDK